MGAGSGEVARAQGILCVRWGKSLIQEIQALKECSPDSLSAVLAQHASEPGEESSAFQHVMSTPADLQLRRV